MDSDKEHIVAVHDRVGVTASLLPHVRANLATRHLAAAAFLARKAAELEKDPRQEDQVMHESCVCASVISSASGLEAAINEFYMDYVEGPSNLTAAMTMEHQQRLALVWPLLERNTSAIEKCNEALRLAERPPIRSEERHRKVSLVMQLRNELVHFKPESRNSDSKEQALEKLTTEFGESPFSKSDMAYFPHRCLSYDCAKWSLNAVLGFLGLFYERMGRECPFSAIHLQETFSADLKESLES